MITQNSLMQRLRYDPETGLFFHIKNGEQAGYINNHGYVIITLDDVRYVAGQLAFLYMTGEFVEYVDHKDGVRDNNKWNNLRQASWAQNQHNRKRQKNNTSGVKGVCWNKHHGKWQAQVRFNKKIYYLGFYTEIEDAAKAVQTKREELHGEFANHG